MAINLISDEQTRKNSWNENRKAIYKTDDGSNITIADAEQIMDNGYRTKPITKSSYIIEGDTMTVEYVQDDDIIANNRH